MHMESPERHLFGTSVEGQESPLFNFLSTLSPIKPIKSLHASQSFTELSFPPPPSVFVTPKVHVKSSLHRNRHKSDQTITVIDSKNIQKNGNEGMSHADEGSTDLLKKSANLFCTGRTGPSNFVEPHLAERMEVELTSTCSMDIEKKEEHTVCSLGHPETLQNGQPSEPLTLVHLSSESLDDVDKGAAVLVPLLSEVREKTPTLHENLEDGQKVIPCTLFDTFDQLTSGYHHGFCESVDKNAPGGQVDSFLMQMSTGSGDGESTDVFREQEDGAANKVNYPVQRGFRRRCLDFRASDCCWASKNLAPLKSRQSKSCSRSQDMATYSSDAQDTHLKVLNERTLETSDTISSDSMPSNPRVLLGQSDLEDHQLHVICSPCGASPSPPSILSGIGLHLNSLTGSVPVLQSARGWDKIFASAKFTSALIGGNSQSQIGLADKHGVISHLANCETSVQSGAISEMTELVPCKGHISNASESMACVGLDTPRIKHPKECASSAAQTRLPTLLDQQERVLLQAEDCQADFDFGQDNCTTSSAKNMRKRAFTADSSGDGCKRCNCKKSKCLKLYCECFAAGLFCIDSCSCHDCHNKPSYEVMVLETRQNIQSRNPLAFAPKVTRAVANSPTTGEKAIDATPASARHKKGCSCKKSKCLKKYCECYQEGVGCSEECRCENCENLYGKKEGSESSDGKDVREDRNGIEVRTEKTNISSFCSELYHAASNRQDDLTPTTPSFQYGGTSDSSMTYQSSTRSRSSIKGVQSPDSLLPSTKSPKTFAQPLRSSKAARNNFEVYKVTRQLPSSRGQSPRAIKSGQFSPRWEGLDDICTLTPLPQAPLPSTTPSVSCVYRAVSSSSLNVPECSDPSSSCHADVCNVNSAQCSLPTKSHQVLNLSTSNPCGRTPTDSQAMPDTSMANTSYMGLESSYEDNMFFCAEGGGSSGEDAIPAILKDPEPANSSMFCLKSNSPKQKRVSPPHFVGSRITSQGRGQSPALRNGRKFTLQSVSSIPVTTYSSMSKRLMVTRY